MIEITFSDRDLQGKRTTKKFKKYAITQGDTFTLNIEDEQGIIIGANFKLGRDNYSEWYVRPFVYNSGLNKWICTVPSEDTNEWAVSLTEDDENPYIYEIEVTLQDTNKVSVAKYYFNVTNQVGVN